MVKYSLTYFIMLGSLLAVDTHPSSIIRNDYGFIDYTNRIIVCMGITNISTQNNGDDFKLVIEKSLKLSKGEAKTYARKNLLDLIKLVNLDGRTVGDIMLSEPFIGRRVESLVGSAFQYGEVKYLEKNQLAISLAVKMSSLAEILIDTNGYMNKMIAQSTYLMTRSTIPKNERISGIIIDARHIDQIPALVPKIYNEDKTLIYGSRHYTRSRSVNRGTIGYASSMEDSNVQRRVGNTPILVEAIGSNNEVNLIVSNLDGERIRNAEKKFGLLSNCKVLVLLK